MNAQHTSYLHRRNTFFGAVEVEGNGADCVVRVRYNGCAREAPLGGFCVETVAQLLLRELVLLDVERPAILKEDGEV